MTVHRPIRILGNARDLIDAISVNGPLTPAEIATITGIPRPSVYRLADGLAAIGLTSTNPDTRVALNLRWLGLADDAVAGMREWEHARPILDRLTDRTEQTAYLTVPRGNEAVCIAWSPGRGIALLILKPGRALPLYVGAAGRVMLAELADRDSYLAHAPFEQLTEHTIVGAHQLRSDIELTRSRGYVHSDEDATIGIGALGVPVRDHDGVMVGCVSIGGLAAEIRGRESEFVNAVMDAAAEFAAGFEVEPG